MLPVLPDILARMVTVPVRVPPVTRPVLLTVALLRRLLDQVTWLVRSILVPSLNVPMAVNCSVCPRGMLVLPAAETAIEDSVAVVPVRVVLPTLPPNVAEMVVVPAPRTVAIPFDPAELEKVATPTLDDRQVTCVVRSCVVPSVYVPMAVYCTSTVLGTRKAGGVTAIESRTTAVQVMPSPT